MAESYDINISIGSSVGATQTGGSLPSGRPSVATTLTLDEEVLELGPLNLPLLVANTLTTFVAAPNRLSQPQTVFLENVGDAVLTVTDILFTTRGGVQPQFYFEPGQEIFNTVTNTSGTITVLPGNTGTFQIAYFGPQQGEYSNRITIQSNSGGGFYRINTFQNITNAFSLLVNPQSITTTTSGYGEWTLESYTVIPALNNEIIEYTPTLWASISGESNGWEVASTSNFSVSLIFDSSNVSDINGIYTATLNIYSIYSNEVVSTSTINTAIVDIDPSRFQTCGFWISPAASYNSIIGLSYDIIRGEKWLTIGVGMGGDGSPQYAFGGNLYADNLTLNFRSGREYNRNLIHLGWANVWRFPLGSTSTEYNSELPRVYLSNAVDDGNNYIYKVKESEEYNYERYFGVESSNGCMFVVEHDGYGNVAVFINQLREYSEDTDFNATLDNLSRAFYYYSEADVGQRYTGPNGSPVVNHIPTEETENQTLLFRGFVYNTAARIAYPDTFPVTYPR